MFIRFFSRYYAICLFCLLQVLCWSLFLTHNNYQKEQVTTFGLNIAGRFFSGPSFFAEMTTLKKSNEHLLAENTRLRHQIAQSYIAFNATVLVFEDTIYRQAYTYTPAQVISAQTGRRNNRLIINKGRAQGLEPGMAVISPNGVVGVIKSTTTNFSWILPILHSDSRISAKIKAKDFSGFIQWDGRDYRRASLIDVPSHFKVEVGDEIITSGFSLDFPEGILLGVVEAVRTEERGNFHDITVLLSTDFASLNQVYVVKNMFKQELQLLQNSAQNHE